MSDPRSLVRAYDGSSLTLQLLQACGWGDMLNMGYFRPTDWVAHPFRLDIAQRRLASRAIRLLDVGNGDHVLDVACGRGRSSFMLATQHPTASVTGMDILPSNVALARELYGNAPSLRYTVADATDMEFDGGSFERVLCLEAAFHFDRARFLDEAHRVMKRGGVLVVIDFMWRHPESRRILESPEGKIVRDTWRFDDFSTEGEYLQMAEASGFRLVARNDWSRKVTAAMQRRTALISWAGTKKLPRKVICRLNNQLNHFSPEDWEELCRLVKAHDVVRRSSKYVSLVLTKTP